MSTRTAMPRSASIIRRGEPLNLENLDVALVLISLSLLSLGLVMVASASISVADRDLSNPFYYLERQALFAVVGMLAALAVYRIRLVQWEKSGMALLGFALFLLILVLIPGVGKSVNGYALDIIGLVKFTGFRSCEILFDYLCRWISGSTWAGSKNNALGFH